MALEISGEVISEEELNRWLCEPVHCIVIPKGSSIADDTTLAPHDFIHDL